MSNALAVSQIQVAVAKQQLQSVEQQGQNALALIKASAPPKVAAAVAANVAPGVAAHLNIVA